jgi:uncharacterized protein (TIGR02145 family)
LKQYEFEDSFPQSKFTFSKRLAKWHYYIKQIFLFSVLQFIGSIQLSSQNQPPVVENVTFTQRTDGSHTVDIYYDVQNPTGNPMTIEMEVSDDNGTTWDFPCTQITGDVGTGITSGTNKHIVWNFGAEHPNEYDDQFRIKIIANDGGGAMGEPCPGIPTVTYEGKTYNTVLIGAQCWLKENLDVGTMIQGNQDALNNGIIEKYCYNNDLNNCDTYGGLYQWNEAMQYVTTQGTKGICPDGWHIPTLSEFETLKAAVNNDGNALKAVGQGTGSGAGTNTSGFSALLAGCRLYNGSWFNLGQHTYLQSSTGYDWSVAYNLQLYDYSVVVLLWIEYKDDGLSIRCLND